MPIRPDDEELTVVVDGQKLGGWEEIHVVRGVERLPSAFYIRTTDRFPGQISQLLPKPGSSCQVYLSGDLILTGYVDVYDIQLAANQHTVLLSGRSKTADMVDSALNGNDPEVGGWQFYEKTIGEAARKLAKPFKIDVNVEEDHDIPAGNILEITPGMTAAQILEELARTTGSLVWDDPQGRLVISGVGTGRSGTALVEGQNIEHGHAVQRMDARFANYFVMAQGFLPGKSYTNTGMKAEHAHAVDPEVKALGRYRTRIIPWEPADTNEEEYAKRRALWEAARRMGRSNMITLSVVGWRDGAGKLWSPNTLVSINAPTLKVNRDMVISECAWERGPQRGTTCVLTCMPPEGLKPQPLVIVPPITGMGAPAPHA